MAYSFHFGEKESNLNVSVNWGANPNYEFHNASVVWLQPSFHVISVSCSDEAPGEIQGSSWKNCFGNIFQRLHMYARDISERKNPGSFPGRSARIVHKMVTLI